MLRNYVEKLVGAEKYLKLQESMLYRYAVDTAASEIFFNAVNAVNELAIAGLDWKQMLKTRAVASIVGLGTSRPYGIYRDFVCKKLKVTEETSSMKKFLIDTITVSSFSIPILVGIYKLMGADTNQIIAGCIGTIAYSGFVGRPYGIFLDWFRESCGLRPSYKAEEKLYEGD